jgi:GNAT superfamily N-acetyltransferase
VRAVRFRALTREDLRAATTLCARTWAYDHVTQTLLQEKVFDDPPDRATAAFGAWESETIVGFISLCAHGPTAWIKIGGADPGRRRRGISTALVVEAEGWAKKQGAGTLRLMDHPGNYFTPGMDVRYAEALEFFAHRGFVVAGENRNLVLPLPPTAPTRSGPAGGASEAYELRRARQAEAHAMTTLARTFSPAWAHEVGRAMDQATPAVHAAFSRGAPVAFAAHDGNNRGTGSFGPAGTLEAHRGRGLGQALLRACLVDIGKAGHARAIIPWVSRTTIYARLGAIEDGRYRVLVKTL